MGLIRGDGERGKSGLRKCLREDSGQMTVDLMVSLPVLIIVAVIAVNALFLFVQCASFDRIARDAVRVYASSPDYQQNNDQCVAQIETHLNESLKYENTTYAVSSSSSSGVTVFSLTMEYQPTLFGMGLKPSILGVNIPTLDHAVTVAISPYKPGVVI